jgi:Lrp/AsnC family leucine-responsive transcriptional regulator
MPDDFDRKILLALRKNARLSLTELGRMINLSTPAVRTRLQKLENLKYFKSYSAVLNPEKFGKEFVCFCLVQLSSHTVDNDTMFTKFVMAHPDILECHRITGQYEYILKIVTKSSRNMEELIEKMRAHENVANTYTLTVLVTRKEEPSVIPD